MVRFDLRTAVTVGWFGCFAAVQPALGAEGEHGGGAVNPIESGTFANAIATLITFGLVVFVLGKFAWKPLLKALKDREDFIRESLTSAKHDREEAQTLLQRYQQQLEEARREATGIVDEGRRDAEVLRRKIQDEARQEAEAILKRAKREIGIARDTAVKDLYAVSGKLATDLAGRILRKELDPATHEQLIREAIDQLPSAPSRN